VYQIRLLMLQNKYEECLTFIQKNFVFFMDKPMIYEKLAFVALKTKKFQIATENSLKALERNPENLIYYLHYFNANGIKQSLEKFKDLVGLSTSEKELCLKLLSLIRGLKIKSRIIDRIELVLSSGDVFKTKIAAYIGHNVKQNIPSILNAILSIYNYQKEKVSVIHEIILSHVKSIDENSCLDVQYTGNEKMDLLTQICWVHYFAALHFDYLRDLEKAMFYINKAIDLTPSVNEFFTLKSKILKHAGMLNESSEAYQKV
jgi:tetratricopeptide (TPR) repeat protein